VAHTLFRRRLVNAALAVFTVTPALGLFSSETKADALTPLNTNEPSAKALNFVPDASKIDARANPVYKGGEHCASCAHYRGKPGDPVAGCEIFPSHSVPAGGWCMVWGAR
jgi:High potential iron-sulfur protein